MLCVSYHEVSQHNMDKQHVGRTIKNTFSKIEEVVLANFELTNSRGKIFFSALPD